MNIVNHSLVVVGASTVDPEPSLIETLETCEFQTENNVDGGFSNEAVPSTPTPTGPQEATSPTGWAQYGKKKIFSCELFCQIFILLGDILRC